jgi:hypothetical protein
MLATLPSSRPAKRRSPSAAAEIAYARLLGRPVVVLGSGPPVEGEGIEHAETPAHAVELALGLADAR